MKMESFDVVILSDLHLGSGISRADEALDLLGSLRFQRLILLGDIFCDLNFRRLNRQHWLLLSHIRKLSDWGCEVVWVEGNHDLGLTDVMAHLVGVQVHHEYIWESSGERFLAIHGHQFDGFIAKSHPRMRGMINCLYLLLQKFSSKGRAIARYIDHLNTQWQRLTPKVAEGALAYARLRGATRVFCGHTHRKTTFADNGIVYYNTGAWSNNRPSYITILEREVTINEYIRRIDNRHTRQERRKVAASSSELAGEAGLLPDVEYEGVCR